MIGEMSPRGERLPGVIIERGQRLAEEEHAKTGNRSDERQQQGRLGGGPAVFTLGKALYKGAARRVFGRTAAGSAPFCINLMRNCRKY